MINPRKNITRSFQIDSGHFIGQWYVYVYYVPYVRCTIVFTLNISKKNIFLRQFYDKHATTAVGSFSSSIMGNCPPFIFKIGF